MKNNKFATAVWFFFNVLLIELLLLALREVSGGGGVILYCAALAIYAYAFSFCWHALQTHIKDANDIAGFEEGKRNDFLRLIDSLTGNMLAMTPLWLLMVPIYYWMFRVAMLLISWLKTGEWSDFTTCDALPAFCNFESNAVGVNKIVNWIAANDFGIFLLVVCGGLGWLASLRNDSTN